ncbi:MAG: type II toxin-antitoxin system Phd/YefM family antitoxin [Jatrophihabitantaceae bacterium]
MDVGIEELRDSLSRHLADVRAGAVVTITDHGHRIARIIPVDQPSRLEQLIAEGRVTSAARRKRSSTEPLVSNGTVSDLVAEHRR